MQVSQHFPLLIVKVSGNIRAYRVRIILLLQEQEDDVEGEAEQSSKEEEFLAICKLHGVSASASIAVQLKAVEAEYHGLKDAGQTHKAEHVQMLHAWKSKKVLEVN